MTCRVAKRITFDVDDAEHIYEWLCMYWAKEPDQVHCYWCQALGKRLERFIGPRRVRRTRKAVKKNP